MNSSNNQELPDKDASHHIKRLKSEQRFLIYGRIAIGFALSCLILLLASLTISGLSGFMRLDIKLEASVDRTALGLSKVESLSSFAPARFNVVLRSALEKRFPDFSEEELRDVYRLFSSSAALEVKEKILNYPNEYITQKFAKNEEIIFKLLLPASSLAREFYNNNDNENSLSEAQMKAINDFINKGDFIHHFDYGFFTRGDSRSPENAGFFGAIIGSLYTIIICLLVSFPIAVMAAVYLEEFAKKTKFVEFIEININNLAAVPSIVYGLLGLSVYINLMHLPRSAPLVGGFTLALMVLPVIIIATRSALKSVPPSIRQAALALGASPLQVVWHHTLPLAMPGVMTGTILGMARALGETAPLLMIGMVAFVADIPSGFTSAATVMPVQVYLWASSPEAGFADRTAAAIIILLILLLLMNMLAIILRKKYEIKW